MPDVSPREIEELRRRAIHGYRDFTRFNRTKLRRVLSRMSLDDRRTFQCIPQLIHVNLPGLPGFVGVPGTPEGIVAFERSRESDDAFDAVFPRIRQLLRPPLMRPAVEHLSVMGSLGSIAHTSESDVDYWVCYDGELIEDRQVELLGRRLAGIEDWALRQRGLEVHFFLLDTRRVRANDFGSVDAEGCGSAQAKLLKEEFYRTATLVMGRAPAWWLVPPETSDDAYRALLEHNRRVRFIDPDEIVDLGHIADIPPDEFFGAALWQLAKSLTSPFKSLLKMALLAWYVDGAGDHPQPLADRLKARVLQGSDSEEETDPYLLMFDTISRYYQSKGERASLALVQKCFYLKVGRIPEGQSRDPNAVQRRRIVRDYLATEWEWSPATWDSLDRLGAWDLEDVHGLGLQIRSFMFEAYRFLLDRAKSFGRAGMIRPTDLTVLGRKLEGALAEDRGKIARLFNYFVGEEQSDVRLVLRRAQADESVWDLIRAGRTADDQDGTLVLRGDDLLEMLLMLIYNGMLREDVALEVRDATGVVTTDVVRSLVARLARFLDGVDPFATRTDALLQPPRRRRAFVALNLDAWHTALAGDQDAVALASPPRRNTIQSVQRVSHRYDLLNRGTRRDAAVRRVHLATVDTWGQLFVRSFEGPDAVVQAAYDLLGGQREDVTAVVDAAEVWSPAHPLAASAIARVSALLRQSAHTLHRGPPAADVRRCFVTQVSGRFHVFAAGVMGLSRQVADGLAQVRELLQLQDGQHVEMAVDAATDALELERRVLAEQRRGLVQIFLRRDRGAATVVLLDDMGRLRVEEVPESRYAEWMARRVALLKALAARTSVVEDTSHGTRIHRIEPWHGMRAGYSVHDVTVSVLGALARQPLTGIALRIGGVVALSARRWDGLQVALEREVYEVLVDDDMMRMARALRDRHGVVDAHDVFVIDSEVECEVTQDAGPVPVGAALHVELAGLTEQRVRDALVRLDREPAWTPARPGAALEAIA